MRGDDIRHRPFFAQKSEGDSPRLLKLWEAWLTPRAWCGTAANRSVARRRIPCSSNRGRDAERGSARRGRPSFHRLDHLQAFDRVDDTVAKAVEGAHGNLLEPHSKAADTAAGMNLTFSNYPRNTTFIPDLIEQMEIEIKRHNT